MWIETHKQSTPGENVVLGMKIGNIRKRNSCPELTGAEKSSWEVSFGLYGTSVILTIGTY